MREREKELTVKADKKREKVQIEKVGPKRYFSTKQTNQHFGNCVCHPGKSVRGSAVTHIHTHTNR